MSLCRSCCQALRVAARRQPSVAASRRRTSAATSTTHLSTKSSPESSASAVAETLARGPTWSIRTLRGDQQTEPITSAQLRHLLRLAALPQPKSAAEEDAMIATLQSQLQFVRAVQRVDTTGVEPLRAIRDETDEGVREQTITLKDLQYALDKEQLVGHYKRPKRVREKVESDAEKWDPLATASTKAGKYFVVDSGTSKDGGVS
ncbi:orotidine 5'-phosphate decarboxylase [Purpureocillium lavendulum]|uniref:Orotidine 5'-phosphate decarboxylase n=1 Tax=Purpureocillium lavendulum TaxID=1247861 RepID=A0AB34FV89_9HYPO|nr:orotidine 5'-phosphate decarboxylase [Purpureocillium lavendulum]